MKNGTPYIQKTPMMPRPGPFLAKVVSHLDPTFMGSLEVEILRPVGANTADNDQSSEGFVHQVKMMTPFYGATSIDHVTVSPNDYNNTQKSYGMWFIPPDVGTTVIVIFIDGDPKRGYWIGCVMDEGMNFMVPGYAATENTLTGSGRVPVAEYNKRATSSVIYPTQAKKPIHPMTGVLTVQGLLKDDIRGITSSSARREVPSMVFGISTPGPVDKRTGAKTGKIGKTENMVTNAFVSRLGGSSFVMDDGDDQWLRKTHASEGPPEYVSVARKEKGGQPTILHNELVRIRTRTGHQILLHNSEDLIYIGNARGTTWIELTSNGKIDIYAQDSISIHTKQDLNFTADRDINLTAGRDVNVNSTSSVKMTSGSNLDLHAGANGNISCGATANILAGAAIIGTAPDIEWNSAAAAPAAIAPRANRVPQAEPWNGHENLDPRMVTPDKTEAAAEISAQQPAMYNTYTTRTDTFQN